MRIRLFSEDAISIAEQYEELGLVLNFTAESLLDHAVTGKENLLAYGIATAVVDGLPDYQQVRLVGELQQLFEAKSVAASAAETEERKKPKAERKKVTHPVVYSYPPNDSPDPAFEQYPIPEEHDHVLDL